MDEENKKNYSTDPNQLVPLWEEMGASTGGLIGRFIGLNFLMGARFLSSVVNPMGLNNQNSPFSNDLNNKYSFTIQMNKEDEEKIRNIIIENKGTINE